VFTILIGMPFPRGSSCWVGTDSSVCIGSLDPHILFRRQQNPLLARKTISKSSGRRRNRCIYPPIGKGGFYTEIDGIFFFPSSLVPRCDKIFELYHIKRQVSRHACIF